MEPIHQLKKEKRQLRRLAAMRKRIYTKIAPLDIGIHRSKEPIPPGGQASLHYRHIRPGAVWGGLYDCAWFHMTGKIPDTARGQHVVAHIYLGGEGLVYAGDDPQSGLSLNMTYLDRLQAGFAKSVVELMPCAAGGEPVELYIDAGYNGFYNIPIGVGRLRFADVCVVDDALLHYYYDYLTVASLLSATQNPDRRRMLQALLDDSYQIHWLDITRAQEILRPVLAGEPDRTLAFTAVGHSHLDLAWLWPVRETKRKAARTFSNQLHNMRRYPDYIYGASQPWQFDYIEKNYPAQFERLRAAVERRQMEPQGAMWVETDTNLSSGEALIRQIWYGTDYFRRKFGREMEICWLPDVFGYNGNLPQLLQKSGIPYFMTTKLSWNEHNKFPYRSFVWAGIDGSEVLVHMPPDETYNSAGSPACTLHAAKNYPERQLAPRALLVFGIGDGGGGPGEAHIEMLRRQDRLAGVPRVRFGTALQFFRELALYRGKLPRFQGELYLEKHQGTYTTQAANKRYNRMCEYALQDVEMLCAYAFTQGRDYPAARIDAWWLAVLFYQFHDILPGSSIARVHTESRQDYQKILRELTTERDAALAYICANEGKSCFNPTSFARAEYLKTSDGWRFVQAGAYGLGKMEPAGTDGNVSWDDSRIENDRLRVIFGKHGEIVSLVTKPDGREYAAGPLGELRLYRDRWLYYNAWDIDWKYMNKPSRRLRLVRHETFTDGPAVVRRNTYRHGRTTVVQEISLTPGCESVRFNTSADYHAVFRMLRADFHVAVESGEATCDIQMGSIRRSTGDSTPQEQAQFEVCAHKYVDLSESTHGISLLNNCKYGHRIKGNLISLNLLRATIFPDRKADRGVHTFTYALYPHKGSCGADTIRESYCLNKPLIPITGWADITSIVACGNPAVVVETLKKAYDSDDLIVRIYESLGANTVCALTTAFTVTGAAETDLMERVTGPINLARISLAPYEIKTIRLYIK